jgi:tetrapyrrole methylase family protein/MazG family protein
LERFAELVSIVSRVRAECPWDKEQTHETLKSNLIEEAYEVVDAIESGSPEKFSEELGDLLMQVLLHAQIASETRRFTLDDVIGSIADKLVRRHPHVFGDLEVDDTKTVLANWERIKREEKKNASALDGVPKHLPSLASARRLQEKASRVGFDWKSPEPVLEKVKEEIEELASASPDRIESELGDILFALVNLGRFLKVDAEEALRKANDRFFRRFRRIEARAEQEGRSVESYTLEELDAFWEEAKREGSGPEHGDAR